MAHTPYQSPRCHFDFNHEVPYETSQEVWDRLLNHNDVLTKENRRLRQQTHRQNVMQGRQVYGDIMRATQPHSRLDQNLAEAIREAVNMPQLSTVQGCQVLRRIQELLATAADQILEASRASASRSRAPRPSGIDIRPEQTDLGANLPNTLKPV